MAKAKPKFNRDDPRLWKAWDDWSAAKLYAASKGYFNMREDGKVGVAFGKNDIAFIQKVTKKRLAAVGVTKPKFKKAKNMGQAAMDEPGTMAHALRLYERKIFGVPKPMPKLKKAKKKKVVKKTKPKAQHKNPEGPPDKGLAQVDAYAKARAKAKKNEIVLYVTHRGEDRYTATFYNEKTKKRRSLHITGEHIDYVVPFKEQMERYAEKVKEYHKDIGKKKKVKKAVKNEKPKKKKTSRY